MKKKNIFIFTSVIILILILVFIGLIFNNYTKEKLELERQNSILNNVKNHYNEFVVTNKEAILYKNENGNYIEYGKINSDIQLSIEKETITIDTKYFHIIDLDLYIYFEDVDPSQEYIKDDRYTNYIYFDNNIVTKEKTRFYDSNNNYLYTINKSFDFKVLIKDEDKYGVEFNNELLYIKNDDIEKIYDNNNGYSNKNRIRTLTYHYIYNQDLSTCNQSICQSFYMFESHLKYIRDNEYFTLTMEELEMYLDGKINIPEKSIVITIDDGTVFDDGAIELLEKYKVNATMFIITGRTNDFKRFESNYLNLESHTDNMHNAGECSGYGSQGGGILCLSEEQVLNDLKVSQEKLDGSYYFAYPFFDFNDRAISLLKQAGFHMAFIGQYDTEGYSYPNKTDKFKLRRMTIFSDTTMDEFISYLN